jgi:hypothetical protein
LTAFLDSKETGPDAYLHFARFAFKVGQAIKEDSSAGTQGGGGGMKTEADLHRSLYPTMTKQTE